MSSRSLCISPSNTLKTFVAASAVIATRASVLAICALCSSVLAGPEGGVVVGGAGTINQSGTTTTINQATDRLAIDWNTFNVGANERVQYIQPDSNSLALNRVLSNSGSAIHGRIDANGHVLLINPNGVIFGENSTINAGGFLASGLNLDPADFMNGDFAFSAIDGTDGVVINNGLINAATGGSVSLIGQQVENTGLINAQLGAVNLAAGKEAVVTFDAEGLVGVRVTKAVLQDDLGVDPAIINSGVITAESGQILISASVSQDIFSGAVNTGGLDQATSVVVDEDGSFTLGGGANVVNTGAVSVSASEDSSLDGGKLVVIGENVTSSGTLSADARIADGGMIELHSVTTTQLTEQSLTSADSNMSGEGGEVKILGENVGVFDEAQVSASGISGGGQVLVGGDVTGANNQVRNAEFIYVGENAQVSVDALENGNGGKLVTFANNTARIYGDLSARGGNESGDGGFIETSGLRGFDIANAPDISAASGDGGTWLIDPFDITIRNINDRGISTSNPFVATESNAILDRDTLEDALVAGGNIIVQTANNRTDGPADGGTITIANDSIIFDGDSDASLTLNAHGDIDFTGNVLFRNTGDGDFNIVLTANFQPTADSTGDVNLGNARIETNGGSFTATGTNFRSDLTFSNDGAVQESIETAGGNISITVTGEIDIAGSIIETGGGSFTTSSFDFSAIRNADDEDASIDTSSATGGGNVTITATNDITSGRIVFGDSSEDIANTSTSASSVRFTAGHNITINGRLEAGNLGGANVNGDIILISGNDFTQGLDQEIDGGDGDIVINGNNVNVNSTIETAGGRVVIGGTLSNDVVTVSPLGGDFNLGFQADSIGQGTNAITTAGGNVVINAEGAVNIFNSISTSGGSFVVGQNEDGSDVALGTLIPTSFSNFLEGADDSAIIDVRDADANDGSILISTRFVNNNSNIDLGELLYGVIGGRTTGTSNGKIIISSGLDVTLHNDLAYNHIDSSFLSISGGGDININASIFDSGTGDSVEDTLDIDLTANSDNIGGGSVNINSNIFSSGGSFNASGVGFNSDGFTINTNDRSSTQNNTSSINGGDISITTTGTAGLALGELVTDVDGTGNLIINSAGNITQAGLFDIFGSTSITSNGNSVTLSNISNIFNGLVSIDSSGNAEGVSGGQITLEASDSGTPLMLGAISSSGFNGAGAANAGEIGIRFSGDVELNGSLSATGINGGADANFTLTGDDAVNVISLNENAAWSGGTFTIMAEGDDDVFNFQSSNLINLSANGGAGVDNFNILAADVTATVNGEADGGTLTAFSGTNEENVWTINGSTQNVSHRDAGDTELGLVSFSNIDSLLGGTGVDEFNVATSFAGTIYGNDGNDVFILDADVSDGVDGNIDVNGGGNDDRFELNIATYTGIIDGGTDNDTFNINVANMDAIIDGGNGAADTINLTDNSGANAWTFSAANSGALDTNLEFSGINIINAADVLAAGMTPTAAEIASANDTFTNTSSFGGTIDARGGDDDRVIAGGNFVFSFSDDLGVSNVEAVEGQGGTLNVNAASNNTVTWIVDGADDGNVSDGTDTLNFLNFANLEGGAQNDTFTIQNNNAGSISGGILGAGGSNTINLAEGTNTWVLSSANNGTVTSGSFPIADQTFTFSDIQILGGGTGTDTLTGINQDNDWQVSGSESGTVNSQGNINDRISFTEIENLTGGTGTDVFTFISSGALTDVNGGGGSDEIIGRNETTIWNITGENSGSVDDSSGTSYVNSFSAIESLQGSNDFADTFNFSTGANIVAADGGEATGITDTVDFSNSANEINVTLGASTINGVENIERIVGNNDGSLLGSDFENTLTVASGNNTWLIFDVDGDALTQADGFNDGSVSNTSIGTVEFINFNNLSGGSGSDSFDFSPSLMSALSGIINGAGGNDTIESRNTATTWTIDGTGEGSFIYSDGMAIASEITTEFEGVENLLGSAAIDTFTIVDTNPNLAINLDGAGGVNNLNLSERAWDITIGDSIDGLGVLNINEITASVAFDNTLSVADVDTIWSIDGVNSGSVRAVGSDVTTNFTNFQTLIGALTSFDIFTLSSLGSIESINGRGGDDTVIGRDSANSWAITGDNSGSVSDVTANLTYIDSFNNIETLFGGSLEDNFSITGGGSFAGLINGRGGSAVDSLVSQTGDHNWIIDATNSGNLDTNLNFAGIENLVGNSGSDSFLFSGTGNITGSIDGAGGTDSLTARNTDNIWTVNSADAGSVTNVTSFLSIENLIGGSLTDIFNITNASVSGLVSGGGGSDTVNITSSSDFNVALDANAAATYEVADVELISAIGLNSFSLLGANQANTWQITGADSGTVSGVAFTNFDTLIGNVNTDSFVLNGGSLSGTVDGAAGNNTLTGGTTDNTFTVSSTDSGSATGTGGFLNIQNLVGNTGNDSFALNGGTLTGSINGMAGSDTFAGDDVVNAFNITGANSGDATGIASFLNIENLEGGSAVDTFSLIGGTLSGDINGQGNTDILVADNLANTFEITSADGGDVTGIGSFTSISSLVGNALTDRFIFNGGTLSGSVNGEGGSDELVGDNLNNNFNVTGLNDGTLNSTTNFESIENLTGNAMSDSFTLEGGTLTGNIRGEGGDDSFFADVGSNTFTVTGNDSGTATGVNQFFSVENLSGNSGADSFIIDGGSVTNTIDGLGGIDTLTGDSTTNVFTVTGINEGTATSVGGFENIENLTGNTGQDSFVLTGGTLTGSIDGAGGNADTFTGDAIVNTFVVTATNSGTATGVVGFTGIENLTGNVGNDTFTLLGGTLEGTIDGQEGENSFTADNRANTFIINAANAGLATGIGRFANITTLNGNANIDRFEFSGGSISTLIDGRAGSDIIAAPTGVNDFIVTGTNAGTLNVINNFNGIENLLGNSGADVFTLNGGTLVGVIDGQGGNDSFNADNLVNTFTLNGANSGTATGINGFSNIENLTGNANQDSFVLSGGTLSGVIDGQGGIDTLSADNVVNTFTITSENAGSLTGTGGFLNIENLEGNGRSDNFVLAGGTLTGSINGMGGTDTLQGDVLANTFTISGDNEGEATGVSSFSDIENLQGNTQIDTFVINDGASIDEIDGGLGGDQLTILSSSGDAINWTIDGEDSGNADGVNSFISIENLTGGEGNDAFVFGNNSSRISGLIDGGESTTSTSENDTLDLDGLGNSNGLLVELGETASASALAVDPAVADRTGFIVVNAHNFEGIRAADGTDAEEASQWIAVTHSNDIRWDFSEGADNDGFVVEIGPDRSDVANTQVNLFNFGSVQGGSGAETIGNITNNITGVYVPGSGDRNVEFTSDNIDEFYVIEITENLISVIVDNAGTTLLRLPNEADVDNFDPNFNVLNTWLIDGENSGSFTANWDDAGIAQTFTFDFVGVNQLQGGVGDDNFVIGVNGNLIDGAINGAAGLNSVDASAAVSDLTFGLNSVSSAMVTNSSPNGLAGTTIQTLASRADVIDLTNVSTLSANTSENVNTRLLSGDVAAYSWLLGVDAVGDGANFTNTLTGDGNVLNFTAIDVVEGGDGNDSFDVQTLAAGFTTFNGNGGDDSLDISNVDEVLNFRVRGESTSANDIIIDSIETLVAQDSGHTLFAGDVANTWTLNDTNDGTLTSIDDGISFTNIANLVGGTSTDSFVIENSVDAVTGDATIGNLTGSIDGGEGTGENTITVANTSTRDFIFEVQDIDRSVVDVENTDRIFIDNINELAANTTNGQRNLLIASNQANVWDINADDSRLNTMTFSGFDYLRGGNESDMFTFNGNTVAGLVDGGVNLVGVDVDVIDSVVINGVDNVSVQIDGLTDEIYAGNNNFNIANVDSVATNGSNQTLIGENIVSTWAIDSVLGNTLTGDGAAIPVITFAGFQNLVGGTGEDNFIFASNVDYADYSSIDGGSSLSDTLDISSIIDSSARVSFDAADASADLLVSNLSNISASSNPLNTLVGFNDAALTNEWRVETQDAGSTNGIEFSGFANLVGGAGLDQFTYSTTGNISGLVDGGSQSAGTLDLVDISAVNDVTVMFGNLLNGDTGFVNIEEFVGSGNNATLQSVLSVNSNIWNLDGENAGTVTNSGNSIRFTGFDILQGSDGVDNFTLANGGGVTGFISGGAGINSLEVNLGLDGFNGSVVYDGSQSTTDSVTVIGGASQDRFDVDYFAQTDDGTRLDYQNVEGGETLNNYRLSYEGVETFNNDAFIDTLTVNGVNDVTDTVVVANNTFFVESESERFANVAYDNVNSLTINGETADTVSILGTVSIDNIFSVINSNVTAQDTSQNPSLINAIGGVRFENTGGVGSAEQAVNIQTANVFLDGTRGDVYLDQDGDVNIQQLEGTLGLVDLNSSGSISSNSTLQSDNDINLTSGENIQLLGGDEGNSTNRLTGTLNLNADNDIEISNSVTTLGNIEAADFIINASGNVSDNDTSVITVSSFTVIGDTLGTEQVVLDGANHQLNNIDIQNVDRVFIQDTSDALVVGGSSTGDFLVNTLGNITANEISAADIALTSTGGSVNVGIDSIQTAQNSFQLMGTSSTIESAIIVENGVTPEALSIDGGAGDVRILDTLNANNAGIVVSGNVVEQQTGQILASQVLIESINATSLESAVDVDGAFTINSGAGVALRPSDSDVFSVGSLDVSGTAIELDRRIDASGAINIADSSTLTTTSRANIAAENFSSTSSGEVNLEGSIVAVDTVNIVSSEQSVTLNGELQAGSVFVDAGNSITMDAGSDLSAQDLVSLSATNNIGLRRVDVTSETGLVSLESRSGAILDSNDDGSAVLNIVADSLVSRSVTGFGQLDNPENPVETQVNNLDIINFSGDISIVNSGEVNITALRTDGSVTLVNNGGNVELVNEGNPEFTPGMNDPLANAVVNSGDNGFVDITVIDGFLGALPRDNASVLLPEIISDRGSIVTTDGLGGDGRPLVLFIPTSLDVAGPGILPFFVGGEPVNFTTQDDLQDPSINTSVNDLLINVESVDEIDPEVFNNLSNYSFDNISILMPRDQRYNEDDDDEEENDDDFLSFLE